MSGTVIRGGRYVSGPEVDYGFFGPNYQRANVFDSTTESLIVYALGIWAGRRSGTVRVRLGISDAGSSPGGLYAQTTELAASTTYTDITGGAPVRGNVTPFVLPKGTFSLAALVTSGEMGHSMRAAAAIGASNRNFYDKGNASGAITNPIGGTAAYNGHVSMWFEAERNVKPNKPTGLTVSSLLTLTPTLGSSFSDPNEILNNGASYDYLNRYQVRIRRNSDGAYVVGTTTVTASGSERSAKRSAWTVPSGKLAYATAYTYEVRHEDRNGAWSDWASSGFTVTSLSSVDRPTAPTGTITTLTPSITAVYRSQSGVAANAVQARLLAGSGSVIRTGTIVSRTVANGAATTLTWAQAGLGSLAWDADYQVEVRARDANGIWSPSWSPARTFSTIGPPGVPTNLAPTGTKASSARPKLTAKASGATAVYAEILAGGTVIATRTMTKSGDTYSYQTTASDLPEYGVYQWRAYAFNGTLYSGASTTAAGASRSGLATFGYAQVPAVAITGPASPVATIAPTVPFSAPGGMDNFIIRAYRDDDTLVYETPLFAGAGLTARTHQLAPAYWLAPWRNGETITLVASVQRGGVWGDSDGWPLTLAYTPPASLNLEVFHHTLSGTRGPNAHRLVGEQTGIASEDFGRYEWWRVELLDDGVTEKPTTRVLLKSSEDPLETELLDAEVTSGQLYAYDYIQVAALGNDEVASDPTRVTSAVRWDGLILHCPVNPEALHVQLRVGPPNEPYEPGWAMDQPHRIERTLSGARAVFFGAGLDTDPRGSFALIDLDGTTADEKQAALTAILRAQSGAWDGRPHVVCWREGRGGAIGRAYGKLTLEDARYIRRGYVVDLALAETLFRLGEGEEAS